MELTEQREKETNQKITQKSLAIFSLPTAVRNQNTNTGEDERERDGTERPCHQQIRLCKREKGRRWR